MELFIVLSTAADSDEPTFHGLAQNFDSLSASIFLVLSSSFLIASALIQAFSLVDAAAINSLSASDIGHFSFPRFSIVRLLLTLSNFDPQSYHQNKLPVIAFHATQEEAPAFHSRPSVSLNSSSMVLTKSNIEFFCAVVGGILPSFIFATSVQVKF